MSDNKCEDMNNTLLKLRENTKNIINFHILNDIYIYGFTGWTIPNSYIKRFGYL